MLVSFPSFTFYNPHMAAMSSYQWNCCGVAGPADFLSTEYNYTWAYTHDDREVFHQPVVFPLACCKREIRKKGFEATLHCAASGDSRQIYNKVQRVFINPHSLSACWSDTQGNLIYPIQTNVSIDIIRLSFHDGILTFLLLLRGDSKLQYNANPG